MKVTCIKHFKVLKIIKLIEEWEQERDMVIHADFKNKKVRSVSDVKADEEAPDFNAIEERNKKNRDRIAAERLTKNKTVLRDYKIKH